MSAYRLNEDRIAWRDVDGSIVAIDMRTSEYLTVNDMGRLLWLALAIGATEEALVDRLLSSGNVDLETARRDVAAFLASMTSSGYVAQAVVEA